MPRGVVVAIEIAEGCPRAEADLIEAPRGADFLEAKIAEIVVGEVAFGERRTGFEDFDAISHALQICDALDEIGAVEFAHHAVGEKSVEASVVIEVFEAYGPGPIGGVESGEKSGFEHHACVGV